jgi:hypothetical protein
MNTNKIKIFLNGVIKAFQPRINFIDGTNITTDIDVEGNVTINSTAAVTDGDKGDITVSGGGATWTIDPLAVTNSKINDVDATKVTQDSTHRFVTDAEKSTWNALIGGSVFQTTWNATTNTPTLTSSTGTKGYYYIVDVAGSTNLDGITDWKIGDWAIFDGTVWRKVDNTDAVSSVNGLTGAVSLDSSNVPDTADKRYVTDAEKTKLSNLSGTNTGDQIISDATISTTDITTNNATASKHGFLMKLENTGTKYLRDDGTWQTVSGGSGIQQYQARRIIRR